MGADWTCGMVWSSRDRRNARDGDWAIGFATFSFTTKYVELGKIVLQVASWRAGWSAVVRDGAGSVDL